jgi:hypothetical protein
LTGESTATPTPTATIPPNQTPRAYAPVIMKQE